MNRSMGCYGRFSGLGGAEPFKGADTCGPGTCVTTIQKLKDLGYWDGAVPATCSASDREKFARSFLAWSVGMIQQGKASPTADYTEQQVCTLLDSEWSAKKGKTTPPPGTTPSATTGDGWWDKQSTGVKAGVIVGGVVALALVVRLATK